MDSRKVERIDIFQCLGQYNEYVNAINICKLMSSSLAKGSMVNHAECSALSRYGFVAMVQVSPNGDQFGSKRPQSNATSIGSDKRISPVPRMVRMSTICTGRAARLWREKSIEKG